MFRLAKELHKAPQMIASDIAEKIEKPDFVDRIEVQGAYVNFFVNKTQNAGRYYLIKYQGYIWFF